MIAVALVVGMALGCAVRWHEEHAAQMRRCRVTLNGNVIPLRPRHSA